MAHSSSAFLYNKSFKNTDQWNEKYDSSKRIAMSNTIPPLPEHNEFSPQPVQNVSIKSNSFSGKKCQVYVHHFNKIPSKSSSNYIENNWKSGSEIHQNLYKHEFSDFYNPKLHSLRKQFDNLSLQSKRNQINTSSKMTKSFNKHPVQERFNYPNKGSYAKSIVNGKIDKSILFKPEHKAIIDKLEESYWAKWKPNKSIKSKESHPKMKGLYTENEKIKIHYQNISKHGRKERGDSNNSIIAAEKDETSASNNLIYIDNSEPKELQQPKEGLDQQEAEAESSEDGENSPEKIMENPKEIVMVNATPGGVLANESDVECNASGLKHTDSFILTAKKQSQEKSPYQQPKCIKLFKNADYTANTQTNYIKSGTRGGSYPLKSCLKKDNLLKSNLLGRPGSPIKSITSRRPGKANRFTK